MASKRCIICNRAFEVVRTTIGRGGNSRSNTCSLECKAENGRRKVAKFRANNPDKVKISARKSHLKANELNPERHKQQYQKHRDRKLSYYQNNKERVAENQRKRNAEKRELIKDAIALLDSQERQNLIEAYEEKETGEQ